MKRHRLLRMLLVCTLGLASLSALGGSPWIVGVVPQFPPEQIFRTWTPVLNAVAELTGQDFELRSFNSIPDFEAAFQKGELDLAYMNPYHAVMAAAAMGYIPIVRDGAQRLSGILVVRADSPVQDVKELDGATVAFPAPNAFGASLYMRALLAEREGIEIRPVYVKTHSNVYRHVVIGQAQAGGGVRRTLDGESQQLRALLRVLYETPDAYPHPLAVHPRVPVPIRSQIQQALLSLADNPQTASLVKAIQMPQPVATSFEDYADLADLGLERYVVAPD